MVSGVHLDMVENGRLPTTLQNDDVLQKRNGDAVEMNVYVNEMPSIILLQAGGSHFPTRILFPHEYMKLWEATPVKYRVILDFLITSGVRYVEGQYIQKHPEIYDGNRKFIQLPSGVEKKHKQVFKSRVINLSSYGNLRANEFFKATRLPARSNWDADLRRWAIRAGIDPKYISSKTTRKTCESWLLSFYKDRQAYIALNMGHTEETELKYYLTTPFNDYDRSLMKIYVDGINFR